MPEITKKDALRWLEMQRDAINTEITYAAPNDKRQYHGNLKIVNWLVDRVKDMTAAECLDARNTLCDLARICPECLLVDYCPIGTDDPQDPRRAVEIMRRWKEEQDAR